MNLQDIYTLDFDKILKKLESFKTDYEKKRFLKEEFLKLNHKTISKPLTNYTTAQKVALAHPDNFLLSDVNAALASEKVKEFKVIEKLREPQEDLTKVLVDLFKDMGKEGYYVGLAKGLVLGQNKEALKAFNLELDS